MTPVDWDVGFAKTLGVFLNGDVLGDPDTRGRRIRDDSFLLLFNAHHDDVGFTLPGGRWGQLWVSNVDTAHPAPPMASNAGSVMNVRGRSLHILRRA